MKNKVITINLVVTRIFYRSKFAISSNSLIYVKTTTQMNKMTTTHTLNNFVPFDAPIINIIWTWEMILRLTLSVSVLFGLIYGNYSLKLSRKSPRQSKQLASF
eukprot:NODE_835_length_3613_cov_0.278600.p5 type:complete len:103 gc:universal NODE_835_length_3613_cov_0.278600:3250-2942(-)